MTHGFLQDYSQKDNKSIIRPGVSLNTVNGFKQPIKLGVRDYIFQGNRKAILLFLDTKGDYKILSQTLDDKGHWVDHGDRNVFITIVNRGKDASDLLYSYLMGSLSSLFVAGGATVFSEAKSVLGSLDLSSLGGEAGFIDEIGTIMDIDGARSKVSALYKFLKQKFARGSNASVQLNGVEGGKHLNARKSLIVTLTAYPAPPSDARAVIDMGKSEVSVAEVRYALDSFFKGGGKKK